MLFFYVNYDKISKFHKSGNQFNHNSLMCRTRLCSYSKYIRVCAIKFHTITVQSMRLRLCWWMAQSGNKMTSLNGNIFHVTGPLSGESTSHQWIPLTKASDTQLCCFLWSVPEKTNANNWDTCVLRGHCSHYDVTVMKLVMGAMHVNISRVYLTS